MFIQKAKFPFNAVSGFAHAKQFGASILEIHFEDIKSKKEPITTTQAYIPPHIRSVQGRTGCEDKKTHLLMLKQEWLLTLLKKCTTKLKFMIGCVFRLFARTEGDKWKGRFFKWLPTSSKLMPLRPGQAWISRRSVTILFDALQWKNGIITLLQVHCTYKLQGPKGATVPPSIYAI